MSEETNKEVVIPEGKPDQSWTEDQLIAYGKREFPDLKLTRSMKEGTLLLKLEEAKKGAEKKELKGAGDNTYPSEKPIFQNLMCVARLAG